MTDCGAQWRDLVNTRIDKSSYQARCGNITSDTELGLRLLRGLEFVD
jgi:hypothetical protein